MNNDRVDAEQIREEWQELESLTPNPLSTLPAIMEPNSKNKDPSKSRPICLASV